MQIRTGVDLVHLPRFLRFLDKPEAVAKVFSASELSRDQPEHLAGVFAIKEAFFKALGENPRFLELEVSPARGKPTLRFSSSLGISSYDVSVSHDQDYALASVVLLLDQKP